MQMCISVSFDTQVLDERGSVRPGDARKEKGDSAGSIHQTTAVFLAFVTSPDARAVRNKQN